MGTAGEQFTNQPCFLGASRKFFCLLPVLCKQFVYFVFPLSFCFVFSPLFILAAPQPGHLELVLPVAAWLAEIFDMQRQQIMNFLVHIFGLRGTSPKIDKEFTGELASR